MEKGNEANMNRCDTCEHDENDYCKILDEFDIKYCGKWTAKKELLSVMKCRRCQKELSVMHIDRYCKECQEIVNEGKKK